MLTFVLTTMFPAAARDVCSVANVGPTVPPWKEGEIGEVLWVQMDPSPVFSVHVSSLTVSEESLPAGFTLHWELQDGTRVDMASDRPAASTSRSHKKSNA